ncbi:MAG: PPC domain-containing protein [Planctomycetaceae bacterium]
MSCNVQITGALILMFCAPAVAETKVGFRQVTIVEPVAVQRGTSADVTLRSNFTLDGTHAVFLDHPGIEMTFAETTPIEAPRRNRTSDGTPFRFHVTVPDDVLPGVYEVRVATEQAVSSVSQLKVTDFPVVQEGEKVDNNSAAKAVAIELPASVCGRVEQPEDVDHYRFTGKAGQSLTFNLFAQRVTDKIHGMYVGGGGQIYLMDGLLTLSGPNGQVIAQSDNTVGGDPILHATLPQDGEYTLEVRDARYAGSGRYAYCMEISDRPHLEGTLPMAVQRGTSVPVRLVGERVDETATAELTAAVDEPLGWHPRRVPIDGDEANPVDMLISEHPQLTNGGENLTSDSARAIELPLGISGQLSEPDQTNYFSFTAVKDASYLFEVNAHRRGLPLDSVIEIWNTDGKRLAEADDIPHFKDSQLYWKAPADGTYLVSVRDLHGRGGPRFLYHLRAEPSGPDFEVHGEYYYAQIAPGTNMLWFARIKRLNGFDGPVEMRVEGLPPGVSCVPVTIPRGMTDCGLLLQCVPDAPVAASLASVWGRAMIADDDGSVREVIHRGQVTCEQQSSGGGQSRWPINTQLVGVTKPLDLLSVTASPAEIMLPPGGRAEIDVTIARHEGFTDPVTLAMSFDYFNQKFGEQLPPGVTIGAASQLRLAGANLTGQVILEASDSAVPVERLPISVLARVSITFSITTNCGSNPILLTVPAKAETAQK